MTSPPKVLIVISSTQRRGAELEGTELATQLRSVGLDALAVALAPGASGASVDVPVLGRSRLGLATLRGLRNRAKRVDIVIAYGSSTLAACALAMPRLSTPFIYRSIGDPAAWAHSGWRRWRTGLLFRRASRIVALWPGAADSIHDLYDVPADRIDVIPNARNPAEFHVADDSERTAARRKLGLPGEGLVVGCIGSISAEKRVDLAVDVVAGLAGAGLIVAGDGPLQPEVERSAQRQLRERAVFTGVLENVADVYAAIDVLLLASSTEGMPGVIIEAAMSGVPVVAPDVGAVRWMFDNGVQGEIVSAGATVRQYADAVNAAAEPLGIERGAAMPSCAWPVIVEQWRSEIQACAGIRQAVA